MLLHPPGRSQIPARRRRVQLLRDPEDPKTGELLQGALRPPTPGSLRQPQVSDSVPPASRRRQHASAGQQSSERPVLVADETHRESHTCIVQGLEGLCENGTVPQSASCSGRICG